MLSYQDRPVVIPRSRSFTPETESRYSPDMRLDGASASFDAVKLHPYTFQELSSFSLVHFVGFSLYCLRYRGPHISYKLIYTSSLDLHFRLF
jgi:hypothetical protein